MIMAGPEMSFILQAILAVIIVLISIFLVKLYKARSFARQLGKQGFVRENPSNSVFDYRLADVFRSLCLHTIGYLAI